MDLRTEWGGGGIPFAPPPNATPLVKLIDKLQRLKVNPVEQSLDSLLIVSNWDIYTTESRRLATFRTKQLRNCCP